MKVIKEAEFEDDSFYFIIEPDDQIKVVDDLYIKVKRKLFANKIVDKNLFTMFDRQSTRNLKHEDNINGTIYTRSAELKNEMDHDMIIKTIQENKDLSRRCVVRLADSLSDYMADNVNTSCLNIIHYHKDTVKLFFRASDMTNELLYDIILIKEFFISNVFKYDQPTIHVIASTAQNIVPLKQLLINQ